MESTPPPIAEAPASTPADAGIAQAERTVAEIGERIVVERLHRVLDEGGIAAHLAFCELRLPYLQGLVSLLPSLVSASARASAEATVRELHATFEQRGLAPREASDEATRFYDRLYKEIVDQLRDPDRPLVAALNGLGHALLAVRRETTATAMAVRGARSSDTPHDHIDGETGLASRDYLDERFGEEILRAQRTQKTLALILLQVTGVQVHDSAADAAPTPRHFQRMAAALLAETRGFDLVGRVDSNTFAMLLPETSRAGAAAVLARIPRRTRELEAHEPAIRFRVGIAVYSKDGQTVHDLMQHATHVLVQGKQAEQS